MVRKLSKQSGKIGTFT